MLCMLGSHHVHKDKIRKIHNVFMLVREAEVGSVVLVLLPAAGRHMMGSNMHSIYGLSCQRA
jgi:hypothetical protein